VPDDDEQDNPIGHEGEIAMNEDELPPRNEEAALDIVDGHPELDVDDLTVDIEDDYGG